MRRSQLLTYLTGTLLLLWTVIVVVLVSTEPDPGEADPSSLAAAFSHAVRSQDLAAGRRLVAGDPGDERIIGLLKEARCGSSVEAPGDFLQIVTADGGICGRIPISRLDGRWYLDPWADPLGGRP
ncbi:MAG TPA: hypothetical protein DGG94_11245 [Micromonosporaceae bacterium]|nr:hypothetical protein [Micromonosporaceae bacterium]HCU50355.1 hypothetical protein [Micromonosporaceae bacterium]